MRAFLSVLVIAIALALFSAAASQAQTFDPLLSDLLREPDPKAQLARIDDALDKRLDEVLADYDRRIAARPHDVLGFVERCAFLDELQIRFEYSAGWERLNALALGCADELNERFQDHPEAQLFELERMYGDAMLERARTIVAGVGRQSWTRGQLARLYSTFATVAEQLGDPAAGAAALEALQHDRTAPVRLIAAAAQIEQGDRDRALELLMSPFDGAEHADSWYLSRKLALLSELGQGARAKALYEVIAARHDYYDFLDVSRALRKIGAFDAARAELERYATSFYAPDAALERFRLELEVGSSAQAFATYSAWRDQGWQVDPLGTNRVTLFLRDPSLPWQARDLLGLVGLLMAISAVALAAALPVSLIHYRGLARRARTGAAYPAEGWQLRHAWIALLAFGGAGIVALYVGGAGLVTLEEATPFLFYGDTPAQVARVAVFESLLAVLFLMPLAILARRIEPRWWGERWSIWRSVLLATLIAAAFRLPAILVWLGAPDLFSRMLGNDPLVDVVLQVRSELGIAAAVWLVVVAAPVLEELIFRGAMLRAFTEHVAFAWANLIQAGVFAALHMHPPAFIWLFILGLTLGWMRRRSGGLLAPMCMHAVFNAIAAMLYFSQ